MYIDIYKDDDNFAISGATLLSDLDLQETYRAIYSVATGRIPSLFCAFRMHTSSINLMQCKHKFRFLKPLELTPSVTYIADIKLLVPLPDNVLGI